MTYNSVKEILNICKKEKREIWQVVLNEQVSETLLSKEETFEDMKKMYSVMKQTVAEYDKDAVSSGKMAGGAGELLKKYNEKHDKNLLGDFLSSAVEYAVKTAVSNACMKRIVAAPTAGSCGIIPGVLIAYENIFGTDEDKLIKALFTASGIGNVIAQNASISGAQGGCQAEIGTASAMAAGALAYLEDGSNDYMCAVDWEPDTPPAEGMEVYHYPAACWLRFTADGTITGGTLGAVWSQINGEFLPSSPYRKSGLPTIEKYILWNEAEDRCLVEIWIPIQKKDAP